MPKFDIPRAEIRRILFYRQEGRCAYCGRQCVISRKKFQRQRAASNEFTVDEIIPRSWGAPVTPSNVVGACHDCNQSKGARSADQFRAWLGRRARLALNG